MRCVRRKALSLPLAHCGLAKLHAVSGPLKYSPFGNIPTFPTQNTADTRHSKHPSTAFVLWSACCSKPVSLEDTTKEHRKAPYSTCKLSAATHLLHNSVGRQHLLPLPGVLCTAAQCCYSICHDRWSFYQYYSYQQRRVKEQARGRCANRITARLMPIAPQSINNNCELMFLTSTQWCLKRAAVFDKAERVSEEKLSAIQAPA